MKKSLYLTLIFVLYISCSSVFSYEIIKTSKDVTNMELILDVRTYDDGTYMLYGWDKILFVFPNDSSAEIDREKYLRNGYNNIRTYPLTKNYFLYLYGKDFDQYGDIIDWNGNIILNNIFFGPTNRDDNNDIDIKGIEIEKPSFLIALGVPEGDYFYWKRFEFKNDITSFLEVVNSSIIIDKDYMISQVKIFNTIDGRQAIVYSTTLRNGSTSYSDAPVFYEKATAQISILTFKEDLIQTFEPVILFEINTMLGVILKVDECQASFNAQNNVCFIRILHANGTLYKSILFSTAGSVIKIENLKNFGSENSNIIVSDESTLIPFLYGGYILVNSINNINVGYIYDENGNNIRELDIPEIYKNSGNIYRSGVLSINNTAWMLLDNSSIGWSLATFETPQELNKAQFQNPLITSLIPSLNQQINKNEILNVKITFSIKVIKSTGKITIYELKNDNQPIFNIRQTYPVMSDLCELQDGGNALSCQILQSTFNRPNSNYMIVVDNGFVRSFSIEEPLSGINKGFWKVTTNQLTEPNKIAESTTGTLQLTTFGTSYYNNFSSSAEKDDFKNALQNQLCDSIPINQSRFRMSGKLLPDTRKKDQLLIEFKILSTQDKYEPNVESIINDLNTIIKNKEIVLPLNLSNLIDQEYGFVQASNIWEENKFILLGLGIALLIFCLIYLWARRRNSEGNNFALIQAVMIWFDLTMDILFIVKNGHDVEKLYIPSVIVLAVSIIFNVISAFKLFTYELKNNEKFLEWFIGNAKLASIFTILSSADVGALSILNSRFGGFELFNSSLSLKTQKKIFYGTTANLFIEDIPQLTIQILYRMNVITYSTIPLLSLITSSILVASDVLSRTYNLISGLYFIHKKKEPKDSNESDLPEVLID